MFFIYLFHSTPKGPHGGYYIGEGGNTHTENLRVNPCVVPSCHKGVRVVYRCCGVHCFCHSVTVVMCQRSPGELGVDQHPLLFPVLNQLCVLFMRRTFLRHPGPEPVSGTGVQADHSSLVGSKAQQSTVMLVAQHHSQVRFCCH